MSRLDDAAALAQRDPGAMLQQVAELPQQLRRAPHVQARFREAHPDFAAGSRKAGASEMLVCGMGGSAIGGDYAATWAAAHGVRVDVWRGYGLPRWAGRRQLLVFSSYSGNTEETLSAFDAAPPDAARLCITTGGALGARAREAHVPCLELPDGLQPRAALGHSLVALLLALTEGGLLDAAVLDALNAAADTVAALAQQLAPDVPESRNAAKRLAASWHGHLPFFYAGDGCLRAVAPRWKAQLHENAKSQAGATVLPEMNHNEIMAWTALPELRRRARLVFLSDPHDSDAVARRMQHTEELLRDHVAGIERVTPGGRDILEHLLTATHLGDYASVYLAFLNDVDPTPVERIEALKKRLADGA